MTEKEEKLENDNLKIKLEKILYGDLDNICFACGERIKKNTIICPFCNTKIKLE